MQDPNDRQMASASRTLLRALREIAVSKEAVLVVIILLLIAASIIVWRMHIDWTGQVREYGYLGVFLLMFVSSMTIFFPVPAEAVLAAAPGIIGIQGSVADVSELGVVASVGAALGELTSYFAGLWGRVLVAEKYKRSYSRVDRWMRHYGGPAIFIFSFTPLPFDLVGLAAGSLRFPLWKFLFYCWVGRLARALLIVHVGSIGWDLFFG